jgi:hypothetical protein
VWLAVGGLAVAAVLASLQVLLLVPRSGGWGPSLVLLGMACGAAVVFWVGRHWRTMSDAIFTTVFLGLLAIAGMALGVRTTRRYPYRDAPSVPPRLQLLLASALLAGSLVAVSLVVWRRLRPPPVVHEVSVHLSPFAAGGLRRPLTPTYEAGAGYYQAICACGWRGGRHDIDDPKAEDRATADVARHCPPPPQGATRK